MKKIPIWKDFLLSIQGILIYYFFLKKSQYWSKTKIEKYQFTMLKKLLIESYNNIPFYNSFYKEYNFDPVKDFNSLLDFKKVPILTKKNAKKYKNLLTNKKYLKSSFTLHTSGSTGEPFEVYVSTKAWIFEQGMVWRHWKWGGYKFRDEMAILRSYSPKDNEPLIKYDKIRKFTYYSPFHLNEKNMDLYLGEMIKRNTKILRGYPSSILTFALHVRKTNVKIPTLKLILTASEVLKDSDRLTIESIFNCKIFNHYGLAEVCVMMGDCEKHLGLHNYNEYGYIEFEPTETPALKNIIGTNLHNFAMPLIRYETGDLAEISNLKCICARNGLLVKNIIGRSDLNILTNEGYQIPTVNFYTMFEDNSNIRRWQIIQHSLSNIQIIIESNLFSEKDKKELFQQLKQRIPDSIKLELSINIPFYQLNQGKQNAFISLIK